ncbi:hypothetical protein H2203_008580 [Taxawa tesnikishii (nom. ined.)]|nr:hypothetical protein H2203_008580 [Dothideales sp. JES 119]
MATVLNRYRKASLVVLAERAGLTDIEGRRKDELVAALDAQLQFPSVATRLQGDPAFAEYYQRMYNEIPGQDASDDAMSVGTRRRSTRTTRIKEEPASSVGHPSSPTTTTALAPTTTTITKRTPGRPRKTPAPDPGTVTAQLNPGGFYVPETIVTDAIEQETERLSAGLHALWTRTKIADLLYTLRSELSSIVGLEFSIMTLELYYLHRRTIPWQYAFDTPALPVLGLHSHAVWLPDLFILLTHFYWSTLIVWSLVRFFIPVLIGWFWNLTLVHKSRGGVIVERPRYRVDPFMFHVAKAIVTWLVFGRDMRLGGRVRDFTVDVVREAMPIGYMGMLVSAGVGIVASLYDAVLKK